MRVGKRCSQYPGTYVRWNESVTLGYVAEDAYDETLQPLKRLHPRPRRALTLIAEMQRKSTN